MWAHSLSYIRAAECCKFIVVLIIIVRTFSPGAYSVACLIKDASWFAFARLCWCWTIVVNHIVWSNKLWEYLEKFSQAAHASVLKKFSHKTISCLLKKTGREREREREPIIKSSYECFRYLNCEALSLFKLTIIKLCPLWVWVVPFCLAAIKLYQVSIHRADMMNRCVWEHWIQHHILLLTI